MEPKPMTAKEYFQSLSILHAALLSGQVMLAAIFYFFFNAGKLPVTGQEAAGQMELYIIGGLVIVGVLASSQLFNTRLQKVKKEESLSAKLAGYRSASILRYALLEAPSIAAIVVYMLTNNLLLLVFAGMIIILFLIYRPTKDRVVTDLELSPAEEAKLDDPNAIVTEINR